MTGGHKGQQSKITQSAQNYLIKLGKLKPTVPTTNAQQAIKEAGI